MDQRLGQFLGNYQIIKKLNEGTYGVVYLAQQRYLERKVAIKFLKSQFSTPSDQEAFRQEAELLERMKYMYVLQLLDFGFDDDYPYLITPFAAGGSLRAFLNERKEEPLDRTEVRRILKETGQALSYIHRKNIIHRDLKPDNILFDEEKRLQLADFGIAKLLSTSSMISTTPAGTSPYMAPEQFIGQASRFSDQYALGCIAYELFTGRRVFEASTHYEYMYKHQNEQPVSLRAYEPSLPEAHDQAILMALAKEPSKRHATINAFLLALGFQQRQNTLEVQLAEDLSLFTGSTTKKAPLNAKDRTSLRSEMGNSTILLPAAHRKDQAKSTQTQGSLHVTNAAFFSSGKAQTSTESPVSAQRQGRLHMWQQLSLIQKTKYLFLGAGIVDLGFLLSGPWLGYSLWEQIGLVLAIGLCICGIALNYFLEPWIWMFLFTLTSPLISGLYWFFNVIVHQNPDIAHPTPQDWTITLSYLLLTPIISVLYGCIGPTTFQRKAWSPLMTKKLLLIIWFLGLGLALAGIGVPSLFFVGLTWMFATGLISIAQLIQLKQGDYLLDLMKICALTLGLPLFLLGFFYGAFGPIQRQNKMEMDL